MPLPVALVRLLDRSDGERRLGPFYLLRSLGQGGFAPVWLACERYGTTDLRTVAVKLFALDALAGDGPGAARERVIAEARALCRVEHPHIVRFHALAIDEAAGVMGLVMEHLDGAPLGARIAAGPLSVAETLGIGKAIAAALGAVHRGGLAHGDVKPANILETARGPTLIDFGVASAHELASSAQRSPSVDLDATPRLRGGAGGTLGYVDPHAVRSGAGASPAADLYALGATLFTCLTGHVPASGRGGAPLDLAILEGRAPAPEITTLRPDVPAALAELLRALLRPEPAARPRSADVLAARLDAVWRSTVAAGRALPAEEVGPFRGLGPFEAGDGDLFFGRAAEVAAALEALRGRGLVALVGPSGSGKSSLLRAGLLPAIAEGALSPWPAAWEVALLEPGGGAWKAPAELAGLLSRALRDGAEGAEDALAARVEATGRGVLIVVDPLDAPASGGGGGLTLLLGAIGRRGLPGVRAVVSVRRDRLDALLAAPGLGPVLARSLMLVQPLAAAALREGVEQALTAYGYTFEDRALADELFAEIDATAGSTALVQFALAELWKKRDAAAKRLTREGLRAVGGIAGALDRHAEATFVALGPAAEETARLALLSLTSPEGLRLARSGEQLHEAAGARAGAVIEAFAAARLVVPVGEAGERRVTLAHESLITQWARLGRWVSEAREDRRLAEDVETDAARWQREREATPLWRGSRLGFATELAQRRTVLLSESARSFLRAARRQERRTRLGAVIVGGALALGFAGWAVAYVRAARAEEAAAQQSLAAEQRERRLEEDRRRDLEAKNAEIERLAGLVASARTRAEAAAPLQELRDVITRAPGAPPPREAPRGAAAAPAGPSATASTRLAAPPAPRPQDSTAPALPLSAMSAQVPLKPFVPEDDW